MALPALLLVLLSAFLHASWNAAAKDSHNPAAFLFLVDLAASALLAPCLLFMRLADIPAELWLLIVATAVAHGFYSWSLTRAYEEGDLTVVYPISRSTPAFVPFLAVPLLGEELTLGGAGGIALVLVGVWLVQTEGSLERAGWLSAGAGFAYLTLATTVAYSLVDKRAMALFDGLLWSGSLPRAIAYYFFLVAGHLPVFWLLARKRLTMEALTETGRRRALMVLGGAVASFASYSLILQALRSASVSYVVAARQSSVVFAVLLALVWLREKPRRSRVLGIALTVAGVMAIGVSGGPSPD